MKILVAGGAGYIGNTVCAALTEAGHTPIILDSLLTGEQSFAENYTFYRGDIDDLSILQTIVKENGRIDCVIHLAGLIFVPESEEKTYEYYRENVGKSIQFLYNIKNVGCNNIIFSSSASVYGSSEKQEVDENDSLQPGSPYARTKAMIESIIKDYCDCYDMRGIALRYFNPIGADPKMRSGSYIKNPSHILGSLVRAYNSESKEFTITGVDWDTRDGSGIRDYIHVWDLARAHVCAVEKLENIFENTDEKFLAINVGRGEGITVKEFVDIFQKVTKTKLNLKYGQARPGDVAGAYAISKRANELLDWKTELTIENAISDALKWDKKYRGIE